MFSYTHYSHGESSIGLLIIPRDMSFSDMFMKHIPVWEFIHRFVSSVRLAPVDIMILYHFASMITHLCVTQRGG